MYVYILESLKDNKHYIGCSRNIVQRLHYHNSGRVKSTKHRVPLKLIYKEKLPDYQSARKRERELKKMKGGVQFKKLLVSRE